MPVDIVDGLEAIEVKQRDGEARLVALGFSQNLLEI